jgi:hypothetical protein
MFETAPAATDPRTDQPPGDPAGPESPRPTPTDGSRAEPAGPVAPADIAPRPRCGQRLGWYGGAVGLTCVLVFFGLRLDRADLRAPFYYDLDALLILPLVKATAERGPGGHWRNEHMGAGVATRESPEFQELYDFPVIDLLHFTLIWLLSQFVANVVLLFNLYFLLTFPLTTLAAMIAFRQLGLTLPAAAIGGLLYSFLPFHYQRWENHYFLAAYWLVPLGLLPVLAVCRGEFPFFRRRSEGAYRWDISSRRSLGVVLLGVAVASAGAYYAFFTCALAAFAGLYGWAVFRTWRALAAAGGYVGVIVLVGLLHHTPTILYQWRYASNPITDRHPEEADSYGLKIAHLVLPVPDHNLSFLANLRVRYLVPNRPGEGENAGSLGVVGTAGFIGLLVMAVLPYRRRWPYGALAALTLFALLLATTGGFGSVFNLLVTPQIRAYNRIGVFIAFFCLSASLWALDRFLVTRRWPVPARYVVYAAVPPLWFVLKVLGSVGPAWRGRVDRFEQALRTPTVPGTAFAWAGVFVVGFLDQTPYAWFKSGIIRTIDQHAGRFRADGRFFAEVERTMPPGSRVFCLPYAPFPEHQPVKRMPVYEHARGYIHTDTLVWSYGAMKWREVDAWQRDVALPLTRETPGESFEDLARKAGDFADRIVCAGFDGLLIDTRGFAVTREGDRTREIMKGIRERHEGLVRARKSRPPQAAERLPVIPHEDGRQFFVDLRPYREDLRQALPNRYEDLKRQEREWVALLWLDGFWSPEEPENHDMIRFAPSEASAWFVNLSDREREFALWMTFGSDAPGPFQMRLAGLIEEEFVLDKGPTDWSGPTPNRYGKERYFVVRVPPGRHAIRFHCTPPPDFVPADHRKFCFFIMNFRRKEIR